MATIKPKRELIKQKSDTFREFYANSVEMTTTYFDVSLLFGKIISVNDLRLEIESQASVTMSPQHAKTFLKLFADNIKKYEEKYGEIPTPPVEKGKEKP